MSNRIVVLLSGGLDSTVLAAHLAADHEVSALSFNYGQRHARELDAATAVAHALGIQHTTVALRNFAPLIPGSSQTDAKVAVPSGHYSDETMKVTVVPNRNMVMLSIAAAHALAIQARGIAIAAHAGDHTIYPDCRPEFLSAFVNAVRLGNWNAESFSVLRPFVDATKADIVRRGNQLRAPMALTWSCYRGHELHCGVCGTCVERREAFALAGVADPTEYDQCV